MKLGKILANAAGGASLSVLLAACATPEAPSSYGGVYGGQFQRTEPQGLPGDTTIKYRTREQYVTPAGKEVTITETSTYSNKERYREQSMGQELAQDVASDAARELRRANRRIMREALDFGF